MLKLSATLVADSQLLIGRLLKKSVANSANVTIHQKENGGMIETGDHTLEQIDSNWTAVHRATLLFVLQENQVLLIRKKRGLGAGKINGPGGKLDPGETAQQCAHREVQEELCIVVNHSINAGRLRFQFVDNYSIDVQVFIASSYEGTPTETDEAIPLWFDVNNIPFNEMWADDEIWLPRVLGGERVNGRFIFDDDRLLSHAVEFEKKTVT